MSETAFRQALSWLHWLYGKEFDGQIWIGGHGDGFKGRLFTSTEHAAYYAIELDAAGEGRPWGVYHRLTTMRTVGEGRGKADDSIALPALMQDLDLRGPGHVAGNYPETFADLLALIEDVGMPATSAWVDSGHGRYSVWRLKAPGLDMQESATAVRELHRAMISAAAKRGWKIDNTSDLARIYRMPGTTNRKAGEARPVTWVIGEGATEYPFDALRPRESAPAAATPVSTPAAIPQSSLFADHSHSSPDSARTFTVGQAMTFVQPFLSALAAAPDGEINVRLNDAACALAHFGEEFWEQAAADRQLMLALESTAYDGATWKAEDTIASARRGMASDWRAVLVADAPIAAEYEDPPMDAIDALLAEMLDPSEIISRPPPKFLIRDLLQFDSESWLIGPPGSKKSFVVLDMAAAVLRGIPWQGFETNPADVVMIVAEGAGGLGKRLKAWEIKHGLMPPGMRILPRPVQASRADAWAVLVGACARLAASARERERGLLVVLDTQARVTVGMKENDATDMGVFVGAVSAIREHTGGCVLTVHHTGRTGGDARGSSAIDGAQTTELKVEARGKLAGVLKVEKQKDIEQIDPVNLAFEVVQVGQDDRGAAITSLVLAEVGSAAFAAAWAGSEVGAEDVETDGGKAVTPFKGRVVVEPWITARESRAALQHWIVQALVDTAETLGLTQSEVKGIVEEKRGAVDKTTFKRAWQKVTEEDGPWADVVTASSGQRWTVDRIAISAAQRMVTGE